MEWVGRLKMAFKYRFFTVGLLFLSHLTYASSGMNYYPKAERQRMLSGSIKNEVLKDKLHEILTMKHMVNTDGSQVLVRACDDNKCFEHQGSVIAKRESNFLEIFILREIKVQATELRESTVKKDFLKNVGPRKIPNSNILNCEHSWLKVSSKVTSQKVYKKVIYTTYFRPTVASIRFVEIMSLLKLIMKEKAIVMALNLGEIIMIRMTIIFEPPNGHKGNVARALFYFSVRYQIKISKLQEYYLKKWHQQDPVDEFEKWRNDQIEDIQGNRNPFIDMPELVKHIDDF